MGLLKEFKEFALRGNVVDMAVGVIIGGAFGKIVSSLVNDVLMPPLGKLLSMGGKAVNFRDYYVPLFDPQKEIATGHLQTGFTLADVQKANLPVFAYGAFFATVIDFTILAFCVFLMVKFMNVVLRKHDAAPTPAETPPQEKLLGEIRDLLKARPI
jgi:large conductance mechanosensitive channel